MNWARKVRGLLNLGPGGLAMLAEAWLALGWADLIVSTRPYPRWRHLLSQTRIPAAAPITRAADVQRLIRLTETAARHHIRPMNCLRRSLAGKRLLERRGIRVELRIGARRGATGLEAHAWLTRDGQVLNDSVDVAERYLELQPGHWESLDLRGC